MTTPPSFPSLSGLGWSVHKKPVFSTIVASHVSGREVRDALYANPIWQFELTIEGMDSSSSTYPNLGANSLQSLMGFFLQNQGQFGTFLYTDPTDSVVTGGAIGTGGPAVPDGPGVTTFPFSRFMGSFFEPVGWVTSALTPGATPPPPVTNVYFTTPPGSPVLQTSGWSVTPPNSLVFTTAPGTGVQITADFTYAFQCRFDADDMDFEEFMSSLWKVESVKFRSLRTS